MALRFAATRLLQPVSRPIVAALSQTIGARGFAIMKEATPDPNSFLFRSDIRPQLVEESMIFKNYQEAENIPLARDLFTVGASRVFLGTDFVTVTKTSEQTWAELEPLVEPIIEGHLEMSGQPIIPELEVIESLDDQELFDKIEEVLDDKVRPMLEMDGGNCRLDSVEDGVVYLELQGACKGCPGAAATLKNGVERVLMHFVPQQSMKEEDPERT